MSEQAVSTAVVVRDPGEVKALSIPELIGQVETIQKALGTVMQPGVHYGQLEDESGNPRLKKPILYKPGAEKLCLLFRLRPRYEELGSVHREDFIAYRYRCVLVHWQSGNEVGEGVGSCNSRERKYRNKQPWDIDNTLLKMACKRALAAGILSATAASDIFDQSEGPVTTSQHRYLNGALLVQLEQRHKGEAPGGETWEEWTRARAREMFGVDSRSQLNAEEMGELIEETENFLRELDKRVPGEPDVIPPASGSPDARDIGAADPAALVLDFGKHDNKTLGQVLIEDRDYVEWLARSGRNETVRVAASALVDGDIPFGGEAS